MGRFEQDIPQDHFALPDQIVCPWIVNTSIQPENDIFHDYSLTERSSNLQTLLGTDHQAIQHPKPKAPVDNVRSMIVLMLNIIWLLDTRVLSQCQLIQP